MEVTLAVLAWLQGTQAWAVPARMAANDTEGWRTAVEAEGAAHEELESRYWVTHTLCRAAVAANRGVIGRVPGEPPGLVPPGRSEGDDERIVAWLAGEFSRWLGKGGVMPEVTFAGRRGQFRYRIHSQAIES